MNSGRSMFSVIPLLFALVVLLPASSLPAQELAPEENGKRPFASTLLFTFHSDIEVCLHHFVYRWAKKEAMEAGTIPKRYPEPTLRDVDVAALAKLSDEERAIWDGALGHYRDQVAGRSILFDDELVKLRNVLAGELDASALAEAESITFEQIEALLPVYRRVWWPRHDAENRQWVAAVIGDVIRFERPIAERITRAYGAAWPSPPNRVDLAPYASSTVAYTTGEPHTVIAAVDEESGLPWGLELLFHEASHSNALEGTLHGLIEKAYAGRDAKPPRNLWHILLFSVAGQATQHVLTEAGREGYVPMAKEFGIFRRRDGDNQVWSVLEEIWYPAMAEGKPLEEVLPAIVDGLTKQENPARK